MSSAVNDSYSGDSKEIINESSQLAADVRNDASDERRTASPIYVPVVMDLFVCAYCYRSFTTEGGLGRHEKNCAEKLKRQVQQNRCEVTNEVQNHETYEEYIIPDYRENEQMQINPAISTMISVGNDLNETSFTETDQCDCCGEDVETAHTVGEYECSECSFRFLSETASNRHRVIHIKKETETFDCDKCGMKCDDEKVLKNHIRMHNADSKSFQCSGCQKIFSRKYHLVRHNLQTGCDGSERPSFPCQICKRIFARKDNLREHLRAHAGKTKRTQKYKCEFCCEEFVGMFALNQHKQTHLGDDPLGCDLCERKFSNKNALRKHRRTHTGEKPYICKVCFARFAAKETLNRHMHTHTGVKPHACEFCGKGFIQAAQLRAHLFHHTGEYGFSCDICGKAFNRRPRLETHMKQVHQSIQSLNCEHCEKTFICREDLSRHESTHE